MAGVFKTVHVMLAQRGGTQNRLAIEDPLEPATVNVEAVLYPRWRKWMVRSGKGKVHDADSDGRVCLAHDGSCFVARSNSHHLNRGHPETGGLTEHPLGILKLQLLRRKFLELAVETKISVLDGSSNNSSVGIARVDAARRVQFLVTDSHFPHEERIEDRTMPPIARKLHRVVG